MKARKRYHSGEHNPNAKLSDQDITVIRSRWSNGETQTFLAQEFGVSIGRICVIVNGKRRGEFKIVDSPPPGITVEIDGWPGYRVSNTGIVYSCRTNNGTHYGRWKVLRASLNRDGYPQVSLWKNRKSKLVRVHTLVLNGFVGSCPQEGLVACHEDGDRTNNNVSNLRWGTPQNNADDRARHGTTARGERSGASKLTDDCVREIKRLRQEGWSSRRVAKKFNVNKSQILRIDHGHIWKHVT